MAPCLLLLTFATLPLFYEQALSQGGVGKTYILIYIKIKGFEIFDGSMLPTKINKLSSMLSFFWHKILLCFFWYNTHFLPKHGQIHTHRHSVLLDQYCLILLTSTWNITINIDIIFFYKNKKMLYNETRTKLWCHIAHDYYIKLRWNNKLNYNFTQVIITTKFNYDVT